MKGRDMIKRFKARLSANGPGLTIAVIAMLVALTGGAFAAAGKLTSQQKKEVTKIAKKFAGKPGAPGAAGPAGPAGPAGKDGTNGTNGTNGKSVTVTSEAKGANCTEGGVAVEKEAEPLTKKFVCNGSPWTAGGTLPSGATETGTWAYAATTADTQGVRVPISFDIPLASPLAAANVHYEKDANFSTFCKGNTQLPTAEPGQLCVYINIGEEPENITFKGICPPTASIQEECIEEGNKGAGRPGAVLALSAPTGGSAASGTYAVQAPAVP